MHETMAQTGRSFRRNRETHENEKSFHEFFVYFQIHRKFRQKLKISTGSPFLFIVPGKYFLQIFFAGDETFAGGYSSIRVQPDEAVPGKPEKPKIKDPAVAAAGP